MSIIKFKLKEEHIKLLKTVNWGEIMFKVEEDGYNIFGGLNKYEDIALAIYGVNHYLNPDNDLEYDPFESPDSIWSEEQKLEMDKLESELPLAIEVILSMGDFKLMPGTYSAKITDRVWKKNKS
jgi:hypothetical protein